MTDPRLLDYSLEDVWEEQIEDIIEGHARDHESDLEEVTFADVFPDDPNAAPTSFEAILEKEIGALKEEEDVEIAYHRAKEKYALAQLQKGPRG